MTELDEGTVLETEQGTKVWTLTDKRVEYEVRIEPAGEDEDSDRYTKATYPLVTLLDKVERGELVVVGGGGAENEDDVGRDIPCTECGDMFRTEGGMKSHRSQVHSESESD